MLCLWLGPPASNDSDDYTVELLSLFHLFLNLDLYLLRDDTSIT